MCRLNRILGASLAFAALVLAAPAVAAQTPSVGGGPGQKARQKITLSPIHVTSPQHYGAIRVGESSAPQSVTITNTSRSLVSIDALDLIGGQAGSFVLSGAPALPFDIASGQFETFDLTFTPSAIGEAKVAVRVGTSGASALPVGVGALGVGIGPPGDEMRVDSGGFDYTDTAGDLWVEDFAYTSGISTFQPGPILGTPEQTLYRGQRIGSAYSYEIPMPNGPYAVTLLFAEASVPFAGGRVFDVLAQDVLAIDDLDVFQTAGFSTAHDEILEVEVTGSLLRLDFVASVGQAMVSGIQVQGLPRLESDLDTLAFGAVASLSSSQLTATLTNTGVAPVSIDSLSLLIGAAGTPEAMSATLFGSTYPGAPGDSTHPLSETLAPGASTDLDVVFAPTTDQYDECTLRLEGDFGSLDITLNGLGGHAGHPYLHPVIETQTTLIDYDQSGAEDALLDGSLSHTHEPGKSLVSYEWSENASPLASGPVVNVSLPVGDHDIELLITDDNVPGESLAASTLVEVLTSAEVPGVLVRYYDASGGSPTASEMMLSPPADADFAEIVETMFVDGLTTIGTSAFTEDVLVRLTAAIEIPTGGTYEFVPSGGSQRILYMNGLGVVGPTVLSPGRYELDARFAVDAAGQTPLTVEVAIDGGGLGSIEGAWLDHDESSLAPLITSMPVVGTSLGGNQITIQGLGFFPAANVTVHWGGSALSGAGLDSVSADEIVLTSPAGTGAINVRVETPNGFSNEVAFTYDPSGPVPINFNALPNISVPEPTAAAWGPDGRFYVGGLNGEITAIEFDDAYNVTAQTTYAGVSGLSNNDLLGLRINPFDPPSPVRLYVSHSELFVNGGSSFTGPSPYTGQVSILEGPNFDVPIPLITGLPTSNHDHAINAIEFDNNGDLLISSGSNTNAGVKHPNSGDLVESPLSAALLKARTSKPGFNGTIQYLLTASGVASTDQVDGEAVDVAPGVDVFVYAPGVRNAYDLVYTTEGRIYVTDNGPNPGFGAASTGPATEAPDPWEKDEINLIEYDHYYGSPNRSRGRYHPRENIYRNGTEPAIPGEFTQTMLLLNSSIDGLDEYRANTFQGQLRGDLVAQKMASYAYRIELGPDGDTIDSATQLTSWSGALGVEMLPGGAICVLGQGLNYIRVYVPDDLSAVGLQVHDVTPWRGPESGGTPFVIGGVGFGTLANTQVYFDGVPASLTSVSATRIHGVTPAHLAHDGSLVDVQVQVGAGSVTLDSAYRFLYPAGQQPGTWGDLPDVPTYLGEVASGVVGDVLYLIGSGGGATYRYDITNEVWLSNGPNRPFIGDHHAIEVVDGKLYVIGGLEGGAEGKVQIFDPVTNLWSLGTDMPWAGGSVSTGVLDGKILVAGGIVGVTTVANCSYYDPTFDTWTTLPAMPVGRNHAAATSDGERFYVIGGRDGPNLVSNGFDDVQIYDPVANSWTWSGDGVSGIAPLPQARGGMGTAVWFQQELYVFGGETEDGPGAVQGDVYDRVDVYDPGTNTWRLDAPMPNPRHGIYPVAFGGRIFLASGGDSAGTSGTKLFDAFRRP